MAELRHRHGKTADAAKAIVKKFLEEKGFDDNVDWNGYSFSASVGMGTLLSLKGEVTDEEIIIDECSGFAGAKVFDECKKLMAEKF